MDDLFQNLRETAPTIALLVGGMLLISLLEAVIPLQGRRRSSPARLAGNLVLTGITFAANALVGSALLVALALLQTRGFGLLALAGTPPGLEPVLVVLVLDFSIYAAHVAMHKIPAWWRFHRVHHADPHVDVTTAFRQHPGETMIRYVFAGTTAVVLGASPASFAIYRLLSAVTALLEHADVRAPAWLDRALSLVTTWPHFHKVHHSREIVDTDSNFGNVLSIWDRLFGTFRPAVRRESFAYGLDHMDDPRLQSPLNLLAVPFREPERDAT